jgi:hypothetical protein
LEGRREEEAEERVEELLLPEVTERVLLPDAERVTVEGARVTPEERRREDPTTEERVEAPERVDEPLRTPPDALVARETLLREAAAWRE